MRNVAAMIISMLALAVTGAMAQSIPDAAERLALARQVVEAVQPLEGDQQRAATTVRGLEPTSRLAAAFSNGQLSFDDRQLHSSLLVGARVGVAAQREAMVQIVQAEFSTENQREIIAFYQSRAGRAATRSRAEYGRRLDRWLDRVTRMSERELRATVQEPPIYEPTAQEAAFYATPAGAALQQALVSAWRAPEIVRDASSATADDYCSHTKCTDAHREHFAHVFAVLAPSEPDETLREHTMWDRTAAELFVNDNDTALVRAACVGDAQGVVDAVARGADVDAVGGEATNNPNVTPLAWAIDCRNVVGFEALLDAGANPNFGPSGSTPVTLAADESNPEFLRLVLAHGGDANAHDDRRTALEIALLIENRLDLVDHLPPEQVRANWNALLAAGADPDRIAPGGDPLIVTAAYNNHWRTVEWLLDRGWDGDWALLGRIWQMSDQVGFLPPDERQASRRVRQILAAHGVRF